MLDNFFFKLINKNLIKVYQSTIEKFGYNAMGLHWSSKSSQEKRFFLINDLMKKYIVSKNAKIADLGCGFGDFYEFLKNRNYNYMYKGYDINPKMINYCKKKFQPSLFEIADEPTEICDFTIISGTYNYAIFNSEKLWEKYLIYNLKKCFMKSSSGLIFNLQVSSKTKIVNNIYYAGYDFINRTLKENFKNVFYFTYESTPKDGYFVILRS